MENLLNEHLRRLEIGDIGPFGYWRLIAASNLVYDYGINVKRVLKQKLAGLPKRAERLSPQK